MSEPPTLDRFRELRPDLAWPGSMHQTTIYIMSLKAFHDSGDEFTEEALLRWVARRYPDPNRPRPRGRRPMDPGRARERYETAVRALRKEGVENPTDEQVGLKLRYTDPSGTMSDWRRKYGIPYADEVD